MSKITNTEMVWIFEVMFDKFKVDKNSAYVMRLPQTDFMTIMVMVILVVVVVVVVMVILVVVVVVMVILVVVVLVMVMQTSHSQQRHLTQHKITTTPWHTTALNKQITYIHQRQLHFVTYNYRYMWRRF